jgi:demethylmenaquinone methyltransferase/2-methoxy-6-polyprenyl-1,4-benzoquinol methylase
MDKRPSLIGRMFDRIAPTYDRLNTILSFSLHKAWKKAAIQALEMRRDDLVLDIASGTGDMALIAMSRGGKVIGIDLSCPMLKHAVVKARKQGFGTEYTAIQGDALTMPFRDETFKTAMVAFGMRNVRSMEIFLNEIHRVLSPHGRLSILEFSVPEILPFKWLYLVYLTHVMPCIGFLISGDYEAYRYLRDSVKDFPPPEIVEGIMEGRAFRIIKSINLTGGICHLYLLEKQ